MIQDIINTKEIIRCNYDLLPNNLFGVAVHVNEQMEIWHAGIFVRYNGNNYFFHYDGKDVELMLIADDELLFFKEFKLVNRAIVPSILNFLQKVVQNARPHYGYYFTGTSIYDSKGVFRDESGMPEYMSCVGICLNVIKNLLLGKDFIKHSDWKLASTKEGYAKEFFENRVKPYYQDLKIEDFIKGVRRITPLEYITAGFSDAIPVIKMFTDANSNSVKTEILSQSA